jgi:large conductance mechanosensitive channel
MLKEFKEFLMRGNVMDLAVGVIIGGAFKAITDSLVGDVISPILAIFTGSVNFESLEFTVPYTSAVITYGNFITAVINFLIMALIVFLMVKGVNKVMTLGKKQEEPVEEVPTTKECPFCFSEIHINASRCPNCTSEIIIKEKI